METVPHPKSLLSVVGPDPKRPGKFRCLCSCGKAVSVRRDHIVSGRTPSCGHLKRGYAGRELSLKRWRKGDG